MHFFDFNISDHLHGRWCRFIIHRYLGHLLEKNLSLEQLSIDLTKGCVQIDQVMLNAQYINETMANLNLPLQLVDGFIGSIRIKVPWASLMADASEVDLSDVQLTFRSMGDFKADDKDLVSSMLGSVVESLVSSIDLAQSFKQEEEGEGQWSEGNDEDSVHALSKVVDAVVSRFCCNIDDLILRIESDAAPNCDMATAVEFKITKLRFMDEQMKMCRQEGKSAETITSQPHGLSSVTNLNKYINLDGVSLYTDTFSKADLPVANDFGSPVTSMYLRREHKKSLQKAGSPHASMYMSTNLADSMMLSSGIYQSCYSVAPNPAPSFDEFKSVRPESTLISNPVKFAEIAGETTIVIRIKNSEVNTKEKGDNKFEFDIYSKGINILVTPSQVELIKNLTGLLIPVDQTVTKKGLGGEPMANRDFDIVNRQLDDITTDYLPAGNALGRNGNWQGVEDFHTFQSISLKDDSHQKMASIRREQEKTAADGNKRETAMVAVKVGTILAFLTHDDPLSAESIAGFERGPRDAVDLLHVNAKRFFDKAAELKIFHAMPISSMQKAADDLYLKDHIRLIGSTVAVSYSVECAPGTGSRVSTKLSVANCDISEYLTAESTMSQQPRHNPLFTFEREDGDQGAQFTVVMRSEEAKSSTIIHLGKCVSELDMSITDRVSHLLCPRPFFTQPTRSYKSAHAPSGLSEDLFAEMITKEPAPSTIEVNCANWSIDLKIPKVDLREDIEDGEDRISHAVQNVHDEFLRLKLTSCKVQMPSKKPGGPKLVEITASKITGHFIGDLEKLGCTEEDTAFLYAGSKGKPVRIALEFDGSNKSLKASNSGILSTGVDDMNKSFSADLIKNRPKKEGPFAQTHQSFTKSNATSDDENIVRAGSREEMATFARECLEQSDVTLRIDFPLLRLLIPNHQFLELLYNRLVNDFALWQPSAPAFKAKNNSLNINMDDCFKEVKSSLNNVHGRLGLESDDEDDGGDYSRTERDRSTMKAQSHFFALQLDVTTGSMVMGTEIAPAAEDEPGQPAQVVGELGGTQMFVCYGFHGDLNQTYFHLTTTNVTIAQRNEPTIPKNVLSKDFGTFKKAEVHLRSLPTGSHLREERKDDSLGVAMHMETRDNGRVKETTAAIALRLLELNLIPVKRMEEWFVMQMKDLFYLTDFDIPGYEMPICNTYLHIHLDHAVLAHDHCRIVKDSPLKYKFVLGNVDINSTLVPSMKVNKFLFLFERVHLHMTNEDDEDGPKVTYEDDPPRKQHGSNMVHILEIGLFQLELLIFNQLMARDGEKRNCPLFELRCQNDQIKAWVCHDSLVTLINTMVEVAQSELWKEDKPAELEGVLSPDEETRSVSSALTKSTVTTVKKGDSLPPGAERRLKRLVENACEDAPLVDAPSSYEESRNEIAYAKEAVEEWSANEDVSFDNNLLEDAMRDMSLGSNAHGRSSSFSTDEEFFMVEDIPGCGITSSSGEPRIRLIDPDNTAESGDYFYNYVPEHIPTSGDFRADNIPLPADYSVPLIRYKLKDISIQLHIFGGNDLGTCPDAAKTYSAEEYRDGSGRGQSVASEARGGQYRDHSVSVVLELAKISYLHQLFDKEASVRSMNFISIQDVTVHDRLTLSNIKEMLYQYATIEHPRRTCAPMIAIRMVENHAQEGKLRVSMLPIRLNIDQDTLEFLEDFVQAVNTGLALPETAKLQLTNHPVIEVPEGMESGDPSPNPRPPPLLSPLPLKPTRSPPTPVKSAQQQQQDQNAFFQPQMSKLSQLDDLDDLYGLGSSSPFSPQPLSDLPPPPVVPVPPPRPSRRESREETRKPSYGSNPFEEDLIADFMPERLSPFGSRALDAGQRGATPPSADEDEFALSSPIRNSLFDMDAAETQRALEEIDQPAGDWASNSSIHFPPQSVASHRAADDLLSRSTMEGSLYGGGLGQRIDDDEDSDEPITDEPFLTASPPLLDDNFLSSTASSHQLITPTRSSPGSDRFQVETSVPNESETEEEDGDEEGGDDEDDRDTICSEAPRRMSESDEKIRGTTFFKEFIFSPDCAIYIDYHGKNKYNMERTGAVMGVLRGIGQLNRTEINLKSFEHRNGLLGMGRCATHAITEWQENIMANIPGVLTSVGPISPLVQIGKGICDLFWMPVSEMRKEDGHVVKGLQRGTSSFGFSTAAAVVDLAQRLVGVVQVTAESVLFEMTPDHPSLNNRNRRPVNQRVHTPQDVRHGMQLAYDLIANGVQQTREDLELATQEDRASGRSSMRSVLRYATPAILRPFVITSQIGYHLLGGLKNQLRPDQFHDEQHKWRHERDRAGTGGN